MKTSGPLSRRERDVADRLLQGMSNKQIALSLGISERTVEFHLNNIYSKIQVSSRVELILKLGKTPGGTTSSPVESTVVPGGEIPDNGSQSTGESRWAQSLRNTFSLIRKEAAMTIHISFEELENYLKSHPFLFSLLALLAAGLTTRYVIFDIGLYLWVSYLLLGLSLGAGSIRLGRIMNGTKQVRPILFLLIAAGLPLLAAVFDQLYLNTALRFTDPVSISIASISATAEWLSSPDGGLHRSTQLSATSDLLWYIAIAYMISIFFVSRMTGKHPDTLTPA